MTKERIALKPYLETIDGYCHVLSKDELKEIIMTLAKEVSSSGRVDFLPSLEACLPGQ